MLAGTHPLLSLSGCSVGHDLHVDFPARQADRSDTRSMPDDARVSVNISGRAVKPAELHEPCGMDRSVSSTFTLQSPTTPAGFATPPVWVATQVSDMFVSTICGGPEVVGVVESTLATVRTSPYPPSTLPSGPEFKAATLALKSFLGEGMKLPP